MDGGCIIIKIIINTNLNKIEIIVRIFSSDVSEIYFNYSVL